MVQISGIPISDIWTVTLTRQLEEFRFLHSVCLVNLKGSVRLILSKVGNILTKDVELDINLNIDGVPMTSRSHTHPSHSQTSLLLSSSLSLGIPLPHSTLSFYLIPLSQATYLSCPMNFRGVESVSISSHCLIG